MLTYLSTLTGSFPVQVKLLGEERTLRVEGCFNKKEQVFLSVADKVGSFTKPHHLERGNEKKDTIQGTL